MVTTAIRSAGISNAGRNQGPSMIAPRGRRHEIIHECLITTTAPSAELAKQGLPAE
jgi:hypothetical protein